MPNLTETQIAFEANTRRDTLAEILYRFHYNEDDPFTIEDMTEEDREEWRGIAQAAIDYCVELMSSIFPE